MVQTAVRTLLASKITEPSQTLKILNEIIYANLQRMHSDKNLTLALLDYQNGQIRLSGQHEETIIVRSDGQLELIDTMNLGFPIGLEEDITDFIGEQQIKLNTGDVLVLYTDGIPEAENSQGIQYGVERLCEIIQTHVGHSAEAIKRAIIEDVWQHIGEQKVFDDITLVVLKQL
jgi:serine phosphatase RsbU (regulator of sigma subunit)